MNTAQGMTEIIPFIVILTLFMTIAVYIFPHMVWYKKLVARLEGKCYHEWKPFACKIKWRHCWICEREMDEPYNYHPVIIYKCSKCGKEETETDHKQTRELGKEITLEQIEVNNN